MSAATATEPVFLSRSAIAAKLRRSPETIRQWTEQGVIPAVQWPTHKHPVYRLDAVLAALSAPAEPSTAHDAAEAAVLRMRGARTSAGGAALGA